ncbi:hypothetical protein MMC11_004759 [Xylographa trunciseda]|nr:hypothetical protein [Xylographa trunciseda]
MATAKAVPSFDDIIQADRLRRKNEALANEIFGKGRRASTPAATGKRKQGTGPSLASRVGITKPLILEQASQRSASSTPKPKAGVDSSWPHDLHHINNPPAVRQPRTGREALNSRNVKNNNRLFDALSANQEQTSQTSTGDAFAGAEGMTIRGLAGPYTVQASNFAPGTTAADIESAMAPIGGAMQSCRIIKSTPTVIAEMVFLDKAGADSVIATFNNQKVCPKRPRADGRTLHVYMKNGPPEPIAAFVPTTSAPIRATPTEPRVTRPGFERPEPTRDISLGDRNGRRAEPEFQDGRYGFDAQEEKMDIDVEVRRDDQREGWRDDRREDRRDDRRDVGRGRDGGRGIDLGRGRDGERRTDNRGLYSDGLYSRPRGRGYR